MLLLPLLLLAINYCFKTFAQCPDKTDLFNPADAQCYEFAEDATVNTFDEAATYCLLKSKSLVSVNSHDQLNVLAQSMRSHNWSQALVDLKYTRTAWKWVQNDEPLRGQGCQISGYSEEGGLLNTISNAMTVEKCINYCSDASNIYAALQQGHFCYCSTSFIWETAAPECSTPCSGSADELCGGMLNSATYFTADGAYDNWKRDRPSVYGKCSAVQIDRTASNQQWTDNSCTANLPFICKFDSAIAATQPTENPAGIQCSDNVCYYLYTLPPVSWMNAERYCSSKGGHLAMIDNEARQDLISRLLFSSDIPNMNLAWIGATNHQWLTNSGWEPLSFDGWISSNEPVAPDTYSCAEIATAFDGRFGLKTTQCKNLTQGQHRFICSSQAVGVTPIPTTTTLSTHRTTAKVAARNLETAKSGESVTFAITANHGVTQDFIETTPLTLSTIIHSSSSPSTLTTTTPASKVTTSPNGNHAAPSSVSAGMSTTGSSTTTTSTTTTTTTAVQYCNATCRNVTTTGSNSTTATIECYTPWTTTTTTTAAPSNVTLNSSVVTVATQSPTTNTTTQQPLTTIPAIIYSYWYDSSVPCSLILTTKRLLNDQQPTEAPSPPQAIHGSASSSLTGNTLIPWWAILIIILGCVILLGIIAGFVIHVLKKKLVEGQVGIANDSSLASKE